VNIKRAFFSAFYIFVFFSAFTAFAGVLEKEITFNRSDITFSKIGGYDVVKLEGCGSTTMDLGSPLLPRASLSLLIPHDAEVTNVEIVSVDKEEITGEYDIYPTQHPQPFLKDKSFPFVEPDADAYAKTTLYPEKIIENPNTGSMGGYKLASLLVYPVQYIPSEKKLIFYSHIKFRVNYEENLRSLRTKTEKQNKIFKERVKNLILNPEDIGISEPSIGLSASLALPEDSVEYVIITVDSFATAFQELADWKTKKGVPAKVVTLDYIYANYTGADNAERVRNFLKDANSTWGTIWVLLGGQCDYEWGQEIVPRRNVWYKTSYVGYYNDEDTIPSDLYFSDLDGDWNADGDNIYGESTDEVDLYSDVFVGRAPVRTVSQVEIFVNKVLTYEKSPPSGYQKKILLPAAILWSSYDEQLSQEAIADIVPGDWQVSRMYERDGELTEAAFVDSVRSGFGFAHLIGHGNENGIYTYYADAYFDSDDLDALDNDSLLGIHNSIGCMCGAIDYVSYGDCFAEHYLTPSTGGSYSIMNSRYGWGSPPSMGPSEHIDTCFYHEIFKEDYNYHDHIGVAHAFSKDGYVSEVSWGGVWAWCIYGLNLFGDPEMPLWTDIPEELTVTHDPVIPIGVSSFSVSVTDGISGVEGAFVCLYKEGEVYARGYTDAFGNINLTLSPGLNTLGIMYCTITKNNYIPYEEDVDVISPSSAWVVFEQYTVMDGSGNNDGNVDPGESIGLPLTMHNVGLEDAIGVTGTVRTEDPYVTLTDSLEDFGDILAGLLAISLEDFNFDVLSECPVNHSINFELITSDINDNTWNSYFSVPISTPDISLIPDTLDFDTVFIGYPDTLGLLVNNIGTDTLSISNITSNNVDYSVDITDFNVPPGESQTVGVIFSPAAEVISTGNLTLECNDLDEPILIVFLHGEGLDPPDISVSPDSLSDNLYTGEISHHNLTIYNTGESDLKFDVTIDMKEPVLLEQRNKGQERIEQTENLIFSTPETSSVLKPCETPGEIYNFTIEEPRESASPKMFEDGFEDGDYDGWLEAGSGVKEVTSSTAAKGIYSYHESSSPSSHFNGIYQEFDFIQPGYVSFYIRSGSTTTSDAYCVLRNSVGEDLIWFFASQSGYLYINDDIGGDQTYVYTALTWYHIEFKNIDFTTKTFDYYVDEELIKAGIPFRNAPYVEEISRVDVYNFTEGSEAWWDEILISEEEFVWIDFDYTSGTIPSGDSALVGFYFDATGLYGGDYFADVIVTSNDPDESKVTVPAYLQVTGAPDIAISEDTIDYDIVFAGYSETDTLIISNVGTDLLTVSDITSDNSDYTVDKTNFTLNPEENEKIAVTLTPSSLGLITGILTITSDDMDEPTLEVALHGECWEPPDISVSPDSLSDSLFTGEASTHTLTIYNTGESYLNFDIFLEDLTTLTVIPQNVSFEVTDFVGSEKIGADENSGTFNGFEAKFSKRVYESDFEITVLENILVMERGPGAFYYDSALANLGFSRTLVTDWDEFLIELESGIPWDLVIVNSYGNIPPEQILDLLDSYQSNGGLLIYADWAIYDYTSHSLLTSLGISFVSDFTIPLNFSAVTPGHSIFKNPNDIENFYWTDNQYNKDGEIVDVLPGASQLAYFEGFLDNGAIVLNADRNCIFNAFQSMNFNADDDSDGKLDIVELIENEISFFSMRWLSVDPGLDTILSGESIDIEVTFDAADLYGGDYYANIIINSNDPDESEVFVPAHLHVTGAPDITVTKDTVDYGVVYPGFYATDTIIISNEGTDTLVVDDISSDNEDYTVDTTTFVLVPEESQEVLVTFTPSSMGFITGLLTIESNDPDNPALTIYMQGECLEPPDISVAPDSLSDSLFIDEISTDTLIIFNNGLSDLIFNITIDMEYPMSMELAQRKKGVEGRKTSGNSISTAAKKSSGLEPCEIAGEIHDFTIGEPRQFASPKMFEDDFEDGNYDGWLTAGSGVKGVTSTTAAKGTIYSYHESSSPSSHYNGIYQEFDSIRPGYVSFYIRSGSTGTSDAYCVLRSCEGEDLIWFFAKENGYFYINDDIGGDQTYAYTALAWYHIEFKNIDFVSKSFDYYVNEELIKAGISFRTAVYSDEFSRVDVYNFTEGCEAWWDEFLFAENEFCWLDVDYSSDTIPAGDSVLVEVTFDATGLSTGNYFADLIVGSNDPDESEVFVPVHLYVIGASGIEEKKIPKNFFVSQNYPNPFNQQTAIKYGCPQKTHVCILLFDVMGRAVNTLIDKEVEAGYHEIKWNGNNKFGKKLPNSVYFYRMRVDEDKFIAIKKMILLQ